MTDGKVVRSRGREKSEDEDEVEEEDKSRSKGEARRWWTGVRRGDRGGEPGEAVRSRVP